MDDRIELTDTGLTAITKLAEGNPGALRVCCELMQNAPVVDPDLLLGPVGALLLLDSARVYGSKIWMLYKDICDYRADRVLGMLRACQLGILSASELGGIIEGILVVDVEDIMRQVQEQLPKFTLADTE